MAKKGNKKMKKKTEVCSEKLYVYVRMFAKLLIPCENSVVIGNNDIASPNIKVKLCVSKRFKSMCYKNIFCVCNIQV